jgi:hypothetical protein
MIVRSARALSLASRFFPRKIDNCEPINVNVMIMRVRGVAKACQCPPPTSSRSRPTLKPCQKTVNTKKTHRIF